MKRVFALLLAVLVLSINIFAVDFDDGKGFRIVEDLGNGYKIVTHDGVSYFKVTDADAAAQDVRNGEVVAWTTKEQEEEYIKNETSDSSGSSGSAVADVSDTQFPSYPSLSEILAGNDSVYVLSGDMPYADNAAVGGDMEYVGTDVYSVSPVTPTDATGLKAALLGILGNYDTVVTVHQYTRAGSNSPTYVTDVQPDYVWLAGAALLLLLIYCLFRLGGALIHG